MLQVLAMFLIAAVIFYTQARLKDNHWILSSSILKLIIIGILAILASIILATLLGNFYFLVILTTLVWASILQIRFAHRVTSYNQTGK